MIDTKTTAGFAELVKTFSDGQLADSIELVKAFNEDGRYKDRIAVLKAEAESRIEVLTLVPGASA